MLSEWVHVLGLLSGMSSSFVSSILRRGTNKPDSDNGYQCQHVPVKYHSMGYFRLMCIASQTETTFDRNNKCSRSLEMLEHRMTCLPCGDSCLEYCVGTSNDVFVLTMAYVVTKAELLCKYWEYNAFTIIFRIMIQKTGW